jgi:hypothetical protein
MLLEKKADLAAWQVVHVHEEPFDVGVLALETIDVAFVEHVFNKKMKHFKQWVEKQPYYHLYFLCGHPYFSPHGTTLTALMQV